MVDGSISIVIGCCVLFFYFGKTTLAVYDLGTFVWFRHFYLVHRT